MELPTLDQRNEPFMRGAMEAAIEKAKGLAPYFGPGYGAKKVQPDEINTAWNTREMSVEQEWDLWRQRKPDGSPMYTPEEIGLKVFPHRERLAKSGGRIQPRDWIAWANQQAERQFKQSGQQPAEGTQTDGMV